MFKRFEKWMWKTSNKRPPKKYESYASTVVAWLMSGIFVGISLVGVSQIDDWKGRLLIGGLCMLMAFWMVMQTYSLDKVKGKINSMHEAELKYWHKKRQEYGLEMEDF
jgi:hypothetical protein